MPAAKQAAARKPVAVSATSDGLLTHLVPDKSFAEEYFSRDIAGVQDINLLRYAKAAKNNVLLFGPTGPGKTSLVLAYAATDDIPLVTVQANGAIDPNTFWGGWQPKGELDAEAVVEKFTKLLAMVSASMPKGTDPDVAMRLVVSMMKDDLQWVESEITKVIRYGGCLYIDEVNFLPPKVSAVFHGLLDKRRQITILEHGNEIVKAHPDLQVIAAYNPDYEGTRPLNAAFKNRFSLKVRFDYDENVERELVCLPVMLDFASKLRSRCKAGDIETPVSTNMLVEFEVLAVDLGYQFAVENFLSAFAEEERQAVGEAFEMFSDRIQEQLAEMIQMADAETG